MKVEISCAHLAKAILVLVLCAHSGAQTDPGVSASPAARPAASLKTDDNKTPTPEKPKTVYESSTVLKAITRLVVVDVVATNKNGEPVTDLKPADFMVSEDGIPQEIRGFSFQKGVTVAVAARPMVHRSLPPNVVTNVPEYSSNGSLNVILLDSLNTMTLDQIGARDQALKVLDRLSSGRAVAVYSLSNKLEVLHDFTNDPAELKNAIASFKAENSILIENPTNGPKIEYVHPNLEEIANEAGKNWTEKRLYATLEAMNSLARSLAGYPGRKNVLWVSGGFPQMIDPVTKNYTDAITRTADLLSNAQIAVYPVDARGSATSAVFTAQNGKGGSTGPAIMAELSKEAAAALEAHSAMNQLADMTGGKAFYNRNDLGEEMVRSMDDGSTYYILGYYPRNKKWNDKFRAITVKAVRPEITLRYRTGYLATDSTTYQKQAAAQRAEDFGQALSLDFPVSTALLFQAGILPPSSARKRGTVAVNFLVDAHQIGFERQDDGLQHATLDYAVEIYSEKGKQIRTDVTSIDVALPPEPFKRVLRNGLPYQKTFDLAPGNYILRLGIRDNRTGLIGSGTGKLNVGIQETAQNPAKLP
jgi:VWFA-related protein